MEWECLSKVTRSSGAPHSPVFSERSTPSDAQRCRRESVRKLFDGDQRCSSSMSVGWHCVLHGGERLGDSGCVLISALHV